MFKSEKKDKKKQTLLKSVTDLSCQTTFDWPANALFLICQKI
jgi:hypothetical protein